MRVDPRTTSAASSEMTARSPPPSPPSPATIAPLCTTRHRRYRSRHRPCTDADPARRRLARRGRRARSAEAPLSLPLRDETPQSTARRRSAMGRRASAETTSAPPRPSPAPSTGGGDIPTRTSRPASRGSCVRRRGWCGEDRRGATTATTPIKYLATEFWGAHVTSSFSHSSRHPRLPAALIFVVSPRAGSHYAPAARHPRRIPLVGRSAVSHPPPPAGCRLKLPATTGRGSHRIMRLPVQSISLNPAP